MPRWSYQQWTFFVMLLLAPFVIYHEYQVTGTINPVSVIMCVALIISVATPERK